ncbi:hypothetical protein HOY80DRAFT_1029360 [Tuber brumale]|nr:hypothetical protein HOY80DRAFT_1029360 [Tuber brumale]
MVHGLTASVNSLTTQVRALSSGATVIAPQSNHLARVEAGLKDVSSQVSDLAVTWATQPSLQHVPLATQPPPLGPSTKRKKTLGTHKASQTVEATYYPINVNGLWYGNPDTYSARNEHSMAATIHHAT